MNPQPADKKDHPMTSSEIARRDTDSWTDVLPAVGDLASKIAATEFVPKSLRGKPPAVAAAILTGRELALGPMASLRGLEVIDGSVSMKPEMMAARILAAGHQVQWLEATEKACTVRIVRRDGLSEAEARFTVADAQRAGLAGKQNWQRWPGQMCRARALANAARMACPDVILGLDVTDGPTAAPTVDGDGDWVVVERGTAPRPDGGTGSGAAPPTAAATPDTAPRLDAAPRTEPPPPQPAAATAAQLRKLNAQLTDWERGDTGHKLTRDERRAWIAELAGADPDITTAKDLTRDQATRAIDRLTALSEPDPEAGDVVDAELVDPDTGEILR